MALTPASYISKLHLGWVEKRAIDMTEEDSLPRIIEDEIAKIYLDRLVEFSKHYGIPTSFTGRICEKLPLSSVDVVLANCARLPKHAKEAISTINWNEE